MITVMRSLVFVIIVITLGACAASGPIYETYTTSNPETAVVYIYRPKTVVLSGISPVVYVNGEAKPKLLNGGYQRHELRSGKHDIYIDDWNAGKHLVEVILGKGEVAYVRLNFKVKSWGKLIFIGSIDWFGTGEDYIDVFLVRVDGAVGETEILQTHLSN